VIYYPPTVGAPPGAVRSAAHEDINLITLLSGATAEGLELLRRDGSWMPVHVSFDHIVVDSGDMLQNVTNGLYKSTTHRVVNPRDASTDRYSMPCFIHPRKSGRPDPDAVGGGAHRRGREVPVPRRRHLPDPAPGRDRPGLTTPAGRRCARVRPCAARSPV
jgi:hypothetical protein